MIYCKKKQKGHHFAIYDYGHDTNNMTGEVRFSIKDGQIQTDVIKYPDNDNLEEYGISKVVMKYINALQSEDFPDKMAYERG